MERISRARNSANHIDLPHASPSAATLSGLMKEKPTAGGTGMRHKGRAVGHATASLFSTDLLRMASMESRDGPSKVYRVLRREGGYPRLLTMFTHNRPMVSYPEKKSHCSSLRAMGRRKRHRPVSAGCQTASPNRRCSLAVDEETLK
ncbi:hypothetical protein MGYG_01732 [Nannizzia gypsea CBS 118893]|uniref:Uncharacterized protein n=1 Tax=Arthroderma gypseum (strain ATCC MYA-4604 / CBS 118893) TaxID=535722 RepID=E5R310_ARTGP|nr:hypothetical protein MGYG_01732 [Nannizzia gypsea CBS 118893]EFQ98714.1 hypothetical protein MGYG_01732 [Nannizzia gypsea CBS 118893]